MQLQVRLLGGAPVLLVQLKPTSQKNSCKFLAFNRSNHREVYQEMRSLRVLALVVCIPLLVLTSLAQQPLRTQPSAQQQPSPVIRGTINVVLGNSHGMVVVTDSAQTAIDQNGQRLGVQEGQKLIKLD